MQDILTAMCQQLAEDLSQQGFISKWQPVNGVEVTKGGRGVFYLRIARTGGVTVTSAFSATVLDLADPALMTKMVDHIKAEAASAVKAFHELHG